MVAMMAVFGQSLVSSLKNPFYLVLSVLLWGGMYWVSKSSAASIIWNKGSPYKTKKLSAKPGGRMQIVFILA